MSTEVEPTMSETFRNVIVHRRWREEWKQKTNLGLGSN